jgi:hypothetical protein
VEVVAVVEAQIMVTGTLTALQVGVVATVVTTISSSNANVEVAVLTMIGKDRGPFFRLDKQAGFARPAYNASGIEFDKVVDSLFISAIGRTHRGMELEASLYRVTE